MQLVLGCKQEGQTAGSWDRDVGDRSDEQCRAPSSPTVILGSLAVHGGAMAGPPPSLLDVAGF